MDPLVASAPAFLCPKSKPGCECPLCTRVGVADPTTAEPPATFIPYKLVKVDPEAGERDLTEEERESVEAKHVSLSEWAMRPSDRSWHKSALKIMKLLMKDQWATPFAAPVDWVGLQIPDYPRIVVHPMDLGTVSENLGNGVYKDPEAWISDVRLVFRNCFLYNSPNTDVWKMGEKLSKVFEAQLISLRSGAKTL